MTSLHYTLIALGVGLVGAMFLYNLFQEHRSRRQAERLFRSSGQGPLAGPADQPVLPVEHEPVADSRIEPDLGLAAAEEEGAFEIHLDDFPVPETMPDLDEVPVDPAPVAEDLRATASPPPDVEPESPLDAGVEYIARLRYARPVSLTFAALLDNLRRISKPIRLVGRREDGEWETVPGHAVRSYGTVELSLLLADRAGPLSEVQIDTFCRRLYEFASEHGGAVSCQDKGDALARARSLDAFCAEVDMLIGLNVIPEAGDEFPIHQVQDQAERAGMVRNADGSYQSRDGGGRPLFSLTLHSEPLSGQGGGMPGCQGISLLFDVPRVAQGLDAFDRMAALGFELASALAGHLVDDGGRPVSRDSLLKDRKRLEALYARMDQHGIPAGGERALRLFA